MLPEQGTGKEQAVAGGPSCLSRKVPKGHGLQEAPQKHQGGLCGVGEPITASGTVRLGVKGAVFGAS